jgi:shikimate kinase
VSSNIITLIGMPGCGKSTVGKVLAKQLGLDLLDTDDLIEAQENLTLQQIVDARGNTAFRAIEEQVLTAMPLSSSVISTGGSVVYSEKIMARLSANSLVIYLRARLDTIEYRVSLAPQRGIASEGQQTLSDLYAERVPLYEHYGEVIIDSDDETPESIASTLAKTVANTIK